MSSSIAARTFVAGGSLPGPALRPLPDRSGTPALRGLPVDPARAYFYWEFPESAVGPYRLEIQDDTGSKWLDASTEWQIGEHYVSSAAPAVWLEATMRDARGFTLRSGRVTLPPDRPGREPVRWAQVGSSPDAIEPIAEGPDGWNGNVADDSTQRASRTGAAQAGTDATSPRRWGTP